MVSAKVYNSVIKIHSPLGLRAAISQHAAGFSTNGSHLLRDKIHGFFFFLRRKVRAESSVFFAVSKFSLESRDAVSSRNSLL